MTKKYEILHLELSIQHLFDITQQTFITGSSDQIVNPDKYRNYAILKVFCIKTRIVFLQ